VEAWPEDGHRTLYDVISYNDVTSALSLHQFGKNVGPIGVNLYTVSQKKPDPYYVLK